jgi:16S rRNA (guanine1207-N2)-methyltransferase
VKPGDSVVHLGCGNGLAAAAIGPAATVLLGDRHVANVEAARRTLESNGMVDARVAHAAGLVVAPAGTTAHATADALHVADASVDVVTIRIPVEKGAILPLLLDAHRVLRVGGRCWLAGGNDEGIKPAVKLLETLFGGVATAGQGGGHRLAVATRRDAAIPDDPVLRSPWHDRATFREVRVTVRGAPVVLHTRPGVFSWEHLDEATALLAEAMRIPEGARVLDLGCGAGVLGIVASRLAGVAATFVDADAEALRSARRTLDAAGLGDARVIASDAGEAVLGETFDVVVTNPPFHHGKATTLDVPRQFIADAHSVLARGGWLQLVANRTLPYEAALRDLFGEHAVLVENPRFKVLAARKR